MVEVTGVQLTQKDTTVTKTKLPWAEKYPDVAGLFDQWLRNGQSARAESARTITQTKNAIDTQVMDEAQKEYVQAFNLIETIARKLNVDLNTSEGAMIASRTFLQIKQEGDSQRGGPTIDSEDAVLRTGLQDLVDAGFNREHLQKLTAHVKAIKTDKTTF